MRDFIFSISAPIRFIFPRRQFTLCHHLPCSSKTALGISRPQNGKENEQDKQIVNQEAKMELEELKKRFPELERFICEPLTEQWTEQELQLKEMAIQRNEWIPVYRNEGLFKFFILLRMNIVTMCAIYGILFYKIGAGLLQNGMVELLEVLPALSLAMFATILNIGIQRYIPRVIGVISVDAHSRSIYRVGAFTGSGNRRNEFARAGDFQNLANSNEGYLGKYAKLRWTFGSKEDYMILPVLQCKIVDQQAAFELVGNLKHFEGMEKWTPMQIPGNTLPRIGAKAEKEQQLEAPKYPDESKVTDNIDEPKKFPI